MAGVVERLKALNEEVTSHSTQTQGMKDLIRRVSFRQYAAVLPLCLGRCARSSLCSLVVRRTHAVYMLECSFND